MYLKLGSAILDYDVDLLKDVLNALEDALIKVDDEIKKSSDPDSLGLFDRGEHIIGLAFTACQKYISSTFGQSGLEKQKAIKLGPMNQHGESYVSIINAVANYWKHCDEWETITALPKSDSEMVEIVVRDYARLDTRSKTTINTIEKASSWSDYTCSNALAAITKTERISVLALIPILVEWRNAIDKE